MEKEKVILGENCCYSADSNETGLPSSKTRLSCSSKTSANVALEGKLL